MPLITPKKRYIVRYADGESQFKEAYTSHAPEPIKDSDLFYISASKEEFDRLEADFAQKTDCYLMALAENMDYEKRKTAIKSSYMHILTLLCLGFFIVEQLGILPSALLLSGQLIYIGIAAFTLIIVLFATWHCINKIAQKENIGLYLLTLLVIWIGFSFSLAVVIYPTLFLSLGILPLFSLPLATISALTIAHYYNALAVDKMLKEWCNMANSKLAELAFQTFDCSSPGETKKVKFEDIQKDTLIIIKPGAHIPVDGLIVKNPDSKTSENDTTLWRIDESVITGESVPQTRKIGETLKASSKNTSPEALYLKSSQTGKAVLQARLANFNRYDISEKTKDPGNHAGISFAVLLIIGITATALLWFFLGPAPLLTYILLQCLSVLTCFSPVMVAIAQELPVYISRSSLFQHNILIKDEALKNMRKVNTVIFDKTGTLTGEPSVGQPQFVETDDLKKEEILKLVASVQNTYIEKNTYARGFCAYAKQQGIETYYKSKKEEKMSAKLRGAHGRVNVRDGVTKEVFCGSLDYIAQSCPSLTIDLKEVPNDKTISFIVIDDVYCGWVPFESAIRPDAKKTIQALRARGIKVFMLTGDSKKEVADKIALDAGIIDPNEEEKSIREKVHYNNQDKGKFVTDYKEKNKKAYVLMAGDGINDGTALQAADIGLSINDLVEAVQYAVGNLRGKLIDIIKLIDISLKMDNDIQWNVWSLLATTALSMLIAAGISYPILGFLLAPTLASIIGGIIGLIAVAVLVYNYYTLRRYLNAEFATSTTPNKQTSNSLSPTPVSTRRSSIELEPPTPAAAPTPVSRLSSTATTTSNSPSLTSRKLSDLA